MIDELAKDVAALAPLRVDEVEYNDPIAVLRGAGWTLTLACPWHMLEGDRPVLSWEDDEVEDAVWNLVGHAVTGVRRRSADHPNDPVFVLTGGLELQVEADSPVDPWVMHLPELVYVGTV